MTYSDRMLLEFGSSFKFIETELPGVVMYSYRGKPPIFLPDKNMVDAWFDLEIEKHHPAPEVKAE